MDRNGNIVGDANDRDMYQQKDGSFGTKPINAKQRNMTKKLDKGVPKSKSANKGK